MSDDLGLSFDENESDRGRHRHRRRGPGSGGGKTAIALIVVVAILGCLGGGIWYGFDKIQNLLAAPDYNSGGSGEIVIEVRKDQSATEIGAELQAKDVVKSQKAFINAANANARSKEIQPGFYKLRKQMRAADALAMMLDRSSRVVWRAVIPEGWSTKKTLAELSKVTGIPLAEFEAAVQDPVKVGVPDWWFNRRDNKPAIKSIEGFLFPNTYEFLKKDLDAKVIASEMLHEFGREARHVHLADRAKALGLTPYQVVTVASMIEREAQVDRERPLIAGVIYNRLNTDQTLGIDATLLYDDPTPDGRLSSSDLLSTSAYNTRLHGGLPPTPIASPGRASLEAALRPESTDYLYYVLCPPDGNGVHRFAVTYAEHLANVQECLGG